VDEETDLEIIAVGLVSGLSRLCLCGLCESYADKSGNDVLWFGASGDSCVGCCLGGRRIRVATCHVRQVSANLLRNPRDDRHKYYAIETAFRKFYRPSKIME
jgi:hypothetical protein